MATSNSLRSLTTTSLSAALKSYKQASLQELQALPTAAATKRFYTLPLHCQYSGLPCGSLNVPTVAGYLPLLGQWKQQQVLHPLFSLDFGALLHYSRNTWIRFSSFSTDEQQNEALTAAQEQMLQVAALAMLHQLGTVKQDVPWLPDIITVQNNWQSLMKLCYWKSYLDSKRFSFPSIRISKQERSIDLHAYLVLCWQKKKAYENGVRDSIEEAKSKLADEALLYIRDELAGSRPKSTKLIWKWFVGNLPAKFLPDTEGWMHTIFHAKDIVALKFTKADVELFEEIFLCECPIGNSISHAFLEILRSKRKALEDYRAFEIIEDQQLVLQAATGVIPEAEPQAADFDKKVLYMIAHAKWRLTHGKDTTHRDAAAAKQEQVTVKPTFFQRLDLGTKVSSVEVAAEADIELLDEIDYIAPDSVAASQLDDNITGEYEV